MKLFKTADLKFRTPRIWSNNELRKFSHLFTGDVVNVSAFKDSDKEGGYYKNYFSSAKSYSKTNYSAHKKLPKDELYLDLEVELPTEMYSTFDIVFNHTTLEHIYNVKTAFSNMCKLSKDVVVVIVPFIQQFHGFVDYNDFWRFTPEAMRKMYAENGLELRYCSANANDHSSIYLFCIGYKSSDYEKSIPYRYDLSFETQKKESAAKFDSAIGANVISNHILDRLLFFLRRKQ